MTYNLTGNDAALFYYQESGMLAGLHFSNAPDFENPQDSDSDNVYEVTVTGTDAMGNTAFMSYVITVNDANEAPTITSSNTFSIDENELAVGTIIATDPDVGDVLSFSITGGADASKFNVNPMT